MTNLLWMNFETVTGPSSVNTQQECKVSNKSTLLSGVADRYREEKKKDG